jgi:hypothetical protein
MEVLVDPVLHLYLYGPVPKQGLQVKVCEKPLEQVTLGGVQLAQRVSLTDVVAVLVTSLKPMPVGT